MGHIDTSEIIKTTAKKLNSYFRSPQIEHSRELHFFASSQEVEHQLDVFVDASTWAKAAKIYLRI